VIHRVQRDQFVTDQVAAAEGPRGGVAAQDDLVVACRQADDLQLEVVLVGPEPWQLVVDDLAAAQVRRRGLRLFERVVDGLEPDAASVTQARLAGAVADRIDVRVASPAVFIDGDAVVAGNPRFLGQLDIGQDPDPDDDEIGRVYRTVGAANGGDAPGSLEGRNLFVQPDLDTVRARPM
jgi:hypothetical protein